MKFKLLVMVKNLCARNIIQNAVQGISKAPDLFLNKHKIMHCFPKFQVYKHNARKMRLSKFIVFGRFPVCEQMITLSHCLRGVALVFCFELLLPLFAICLMHVCVQILFSYDIQIDGLSVCH